MSTFVDSNVDVYLITLDMWRAQRRVASSCGCKSRRGKSQSHVAWMAGRYGNVPVWSPSTKSVEDGQANIRVVTNVNVEVAS